MSRLTRKAAETVLSNPGRFLYVTYGDESVYAVNGAGTVPRRIAEDLTLFGQLPIQRKTSGNGLMLIPAEDGLFPGFSQTWHANKE